MKGSFNDKRKTKKTFSNAECSQFSHDLDGNMTQCGDWTYTYDAANRLKTVSSNGVLIVTNFYDAKSRRVKKVTQEATMTFFYDGWNLVEERIAYTNGTTSIIHYYWGKDLSGTLQGAGCVGGLLYLTIDGMPYVPNYDNIGNITRYLDANGNVVAQYTYDAFGGTVSQSGSLASFFRHRFSTKYFDSEAAVYYYGYRFYSPALMRWLTRDPLEERDSANLYQFVGNDAIKFYDSDGRFVLPITTMSPYSPDDTQGGESPSVFDQFGSGKGPFHEEGWFDNNYSGWMEIARTTFIKEISRSVDCNSTMINRKSSRQSISPGVAGNMPWGMPTGGNDRQYGDKGQNNWQTVAVLGSFAIDYVTPITIRYGSCKNGTRTYNWSTTMYVEDTLGLQGNESWLGKYFGWAAKSRRVRRAQWTISGTGTCSCCE